MRWTDQCRSGAVILPVRDHANSGYQVATETLTREAILAKVTELLESVLDADSLVLTEQTTAEDVEDWDSVNHVRLLIAIENELGFRFDTEEVEKFKNVGDLVDMIQAKLKS